MAAPTHADVTAYMGPAGTTYSEDEITKALAAETAAQRRVCRISGNDLPPDLLEALLRRVARNLSMRRLPLGVMGDEAGTRLGSTDPEVRRLEGPYRKLTVG